MANINLNLNTYVTLPYLFAAFAVYGLAAAASTVNKNLKSNTFDISYLFSLRTQSEYITDIEKLDLKPVRTRKSGTFGSKKKVDAADSKRLDALQDIAVRVGKASVDSLLNASILLSGMKLLLSLPVITDAALSKSATSDFGSWLGDAAQTAVTASPDEEVVADVSGIDAEGFPVDCDAVRLMTYMIGKVLTGVQKEFQGVIKNHFVLPGTSSRYSHSNMLLNVDLISNNSAQPQRNTDSVSQPKYVQRGGEDNLKKMMNAFNKQNKQKNKSQSQSPRAWTLRTYYASFVPPMKSEPWPTYVCVRIQRKAGQVLTFTSEETSPQGLTYRLHAAVLAVKAFSNVAPNTSMLSHRCVHDTVYLRAAGDNTGDLFYKYQLNDVHDDYVLQRSDARRHDPDFENDEMFRKYTVGLIYTLY